MTATQKAISLGTAKAPEQALILTQQRIANLAALTDALGKAQQQVDMIQDQIDAINLELHATYVETSIALDTKVGVVRKAKGWFN